MIPVFCLYRPDTNTLDFYSSEENPRCVYQEPCAPIDRFDFMNLGVPRQWAVAAGIAASNGADLISFATRFRFQE